MLATSAAHLAGCGRRPTRHEDKKQRWTSDDRYDAGAATKTDASEATELRKTIRRISKRSGDTAAEAAAISTAQTCEECDGRGRWAHRLRA